MQHFTVIFLGDADPPRRLLFLKRSAEKEFAPGRYTGVGGHVECGESAMQGAVRELGEEAGVHGLPLQPFAGLSYRDGEVVIHYYFAVWENDGTVPDCPEGVLSWNGIDGMEDLDLIPSTRVVLRLWRERGFRTVDPFTVLWRHDGDYDVRPGLAEQPPEPEAVGR